MISSILQLFVVNCVEELELKWVSYLWFNINYFAGVVRIFAGLFYCSDYEPM
jgi:hypothetical protein